MSSKNDVYDQPATVTPNVLSNDILDVRWPGDYNSLTQSVSTYFNFSIAQNAGQVRILPVVKFG